MAVVSLVPLDDSSQHWDQACVLSLEVQAQVVQAQEYSSNVQAGLADEDEKEKEKKATETLKTLKNVTKTGNCYSRLPLEGAICKPSLFIHEFHSVWCLQQEKIFSETYCISVVFTQRKETGNVFLYEGIQLIDFPLLDAVDGRT